MCKIANNIIYNNGSLMLLHDMSPAICEIFRIRKSHKSIPFHSCKILVSSLVLLCMDYCNILLVSLPACLINKLESLYRYAVRRTVFVVHHTFIVTLCRTLYDVQCIHCNGWHVYVSSITYIIENDMEQWHN